MNKLPYSYSLVGGLPENEYLEDYVMNTCIRSWQKVLSVPVCTVEPNSNHGYRILRAEKLPVTINEQYGAQSFVDEDLLIGRNIRSGVDFTSTPHKGGYLLNFGSTKYVVRKAKPFEYSSIHAYLTREGETIYNHTFIQKMFYGDFLASNNTSQWRMPFSPLQASTLAVSWQLIDSEGGKWECVAPTLQRPDYIPRLTYFNLTNEKAAFVNLAAGTQAGYNESTHTFTYTPGCKIRLFFINSPLGGKEWGCEVEMNLDTNEITFL